MHGVQALKGCYWNPNMLWQTSYVDKLCEYHLWNNKLNPFRRLYVYPRTRQQAFSLSLVYILAPPSSILAYTAKVATFLSPFLVFLLSVRQINAFLMLFSRKVGGGAIDDDIKRE